jgi:uncharacterized protein YlzI (FlbEa/FlbD family)
LLYINNRLINITKGPEMTIKCTLPNGETRVLENVSEKVIDRLPEGWRSEIVENEKNVVDSYTTGGKSVCD